MSEEKKTSFKRFLDYFPELELPIILTADAHHEFSKTNTPLPQPMIQEYILDQSLQATTDAYDEYIPCIKIPKTDAFHAIVYFKATLLVYEYYLITYDLEGHEISREKIGGMLTEGEKIHRAIPTIGEDWVIHIVEGSDELESKKYQPSDSRAFSMELLPDGKIIYSLSEHDI
ncbi:MAG: hypothetical protein GVX78_03920 [Bacteroidetes bacterium]|jgi:hypothetical protein|nr:hypothetical protein [Bacteroidota bacterium]